MPVPLVVAPKGLRNLTLVIDPKAPYFLRVLSVVRIFRTGTKQSSRINEPNPARDVLVGVLPPNQTELRMSTIKLFAVALITCAVSFSVEPSVLLAQSTDRNDTGLSEIYPGDFTYNDGAGSEPLEIIPNPNLARQQSYRPRPDFRAQADYRTDADYQWRPFPPARRGRDLTSSNVRAADDYARNPANRQPYRGAYQSTLEAERTQARRYGDRRDYEFRRAQFAEEGPRFDRPQDYHRQDDRRQGGPRGCRGGSCGRNHGQGYDEGQSFDGQLPPYIERGPLNRDEADLPPQLGVYRPSQRVPYRN